MLELDLKDQVALVTGGSEGIGKAIAHKLAAEGCRVAICARRADLLHAAAEEMRQATGAQILAVPADVTRPESLERLLAAVVGAFGRVDILVSNAGRSAAHHFEDATEEMWQEDFALKFWAAVRCARLVVPHMQARGSGAIVNITHPGGKAPGDREGRSTLHHEQPAGPLAGRALDDVRRAVAEGFGQALLPQIGGLHHVGISGNDTVSGHARTPLGWV